MSKLPKQLPVTGEAPVPASIMRRFADRKAFEKAVKDEYISRPPYQPLPPNLPQGNSHSFHNLYVETELLFYYHPLNGGHQTGTTNTPLDISYENVGKMSLSEFERFYERNVPPQYRTEPPDSTLHGGKDKSDTYRAVYKVRGFVDDYAGFITNPPYPARKRTKRINQTKWLLPALLGLATGLAAVPLLRALRAQSEE